VREHGRGTQVIITLHGGPAAAGDIAPLARELGKHWRVLEPYQRGSSSQPLSVATHAEDLDDLIEQRTRGSRPILVGHSWGAMLALAYAAGHPGRAAGLVLIGCGTFSVVARQEFERRLDAKLTPGDRADIARLERDEPDANRRLAMLGRLMTRVYGYDVEEISVDVDVLDAQAHEQTWADMVRLQRDGVYPAAFAAIDAPVLMLHGDVDPHPGRLIAEDLRSYIPHLEYLEFPKCGHSPWLERQSRGAFFTALEAWVGARTRKACHMMSERLEYRPVTAATLDDFHRLVQDDHVRRYLMDGELLPREWSEKRVRDSTALFERCGVGLWLAHQRESGDVMGFCGFLDIPSMHPQPQLVYAMFKRCTGQGYATEMARASIAEARRHSGFSTIVASVDEANVASVRVLEKLGFRRASRHPGAFGDALLFVLEASCLDQPIDRSR